MSESCTRQVNYWRLRAQPHRRPQLFPYASSVSFDVETIDPRKFVDVPGKNSRIRAADRSPRDEGVTSTDTLTTVEQVMLDRDRASDDCPCNRKNNELIDTLVKLRAVLCTLPAKTDTDLENGECRKSDRRLRIAELD